MTTSDFPHLRAALIAHPWAILPTNLQAIAEVVSRRLEGYRLSREEIKEIKGKRAPNGSLLYVPVVGPVQSDEDHIYQTLVNNGVTLPIDQWATFKSTLLPVSSSSIGLVPINSGGVASAGLVLPIGAATAAAPKAQKGGSIAVINAFGIIAQRASAVDDISGPGGTSTERLTQSVRSAVNDPNVSAVVIQFDSPGGNVYGVREAFSAISAMKGSKPIIAQVSSLAASAAYWLACACDEIVVTPSGEVGSIGVYALHQDISGALKIAGVTPTFIAAGKYKVEGNSYQPLTDEAASAIQQSVDRYYTMFIGDVAKGRRVTTDFARSGMGEGRTVGATDAVKMKMADRVGTLDDTLRRLGAGKNPPSPAAAAAEPPAPFVTLEQTFGCIQALLDDGTISADQARDAVAALRGFEMDTPAGDASADANDGGITEEVIDQSLQEAADALIALAEQQRLEAEEAKKRSATSSDEFRRRRHAHRLRTA